MDKFYLFRLGFIFAVVQRAYNCWLLVHRIANMKFNKLEYKFVLISFILLSSFKPKEPPGMRHGKKRKEAITN